MKVNFELKYVFCILLCLFLVVGLFTGKSGGNITVAMTQDASALGAVYLVDLNSSARNNLLADYNFTFSPTSRSAEKFFLSGDADIAVISAERAALLAAGNEDIVCVAYLSKPSYSIFTTNESAKSVSDISGKIVYYNSTTEVGEYIFRAVCNDAGINPDISITLRALGTNRELRQELASYNDRKMIIASDPFAASLSNSSAGIKLINLVEEFEKSRPDTALIGSCVVTTREFAESHESVISEFLEQYEVSAKKCKEDAAAASKLAVEYGISPKALTAETVINTNELEVITGEKFKEDMTSYFDFIAENNIVTITRKPTDSFYYILEN